MLQFTKYRIFLKHLTIKKLFNLACVSLSYTLSLIRRKPVRWGLPMSMSIEPTNYCNLHCPQCPVGLNSLTRPKGFMDFSLYKKIIDQSAPYLLNLFLYFQGEPFLHKSIIDFINYAESKNIFTGLSTNAQLIDYKTAQQIILSGLSYIIISLDGMDQDTYAQYRRGGNINSVFAAINNLQKAKEHLGSSTPAIELQFIVLKTNETQISDFLEFCRKLHGVKCSLKSAQIENFNTAAQFVPNIEKYSRYYLKDGEWLRKKKIKNRCWRLWNSVVITWDGQVLPCCFDKDAKYSFGNIAVQSLACVIKNDFFKKFAGTVLTNRKKIDICRNCTE